MTQVMLAALAATALGAAPTSSSAASSSPTLSAVQTARPQVQVLAQQSAPKKSVDIPLWIDGCDHNYVDASRRRENICVPLNGPRGRPVDCAYLKKLKISALIVRGTDQKRLAGQGRMAPQGKIVCG
ncbi:MAG: hypothetical protein M3186_06255 [Actinomycetota bacterium]|nr:hypothetical protein [Actinomycetota bacterium]